MLGLFKKKQNNTGSSEQFWAWFQKNADNYRAFINADPKGRDMRLYNKLIVELQKVDARLSPELTVDEDGTTVLVLTCHGDEEAADRLIMIADQAPQLQGWRVQRFRAPGEPDLGIRLNGLELSVDDMRIAYQVDDEEKRVHVGLFISGYQDDNKTFKEIAFLLLDHSIGEYNTMMHLGGIQFAALEDAPPNADMLTPDELRQLIERKFY